MELHVRRTHQPHGRVTDLRIVGDVDEIAGRREFGAAGEAIAMHRSDHRLGQVPDAEPAFDDVPRPLPGTARRIIGLVLPIVGAEIVAGAEGGTRAAQDADANRGIAVRGLQRGENGTAQGIVERIALFRPIHGKAMYARRGLVDQQQGRYGHQAPPSGDGRLMSDRAGAVVNLALLGRRRQDGRHRWSLGSRPGCR